MPDNPQEFPPDSASVRVAFGACSRRNRRQELNTDHYMIVEYGRHHYILMTSLPDEQIQRRFNEYGYGMIVADGIGGRGESASRLALERLMQLVLEFGRWHLRIDAPVAEEIMDRARRFVRHVDISLVDDSLTPRPDLQTTLTAVWGAGRDLFCCHVGHSRAYLCRGGRLLRLTRDHTVGPDRTSGVPLAPLVEVSHAVRDLTHIITETIGMSGPVAPRIDIERVPVSDGDVVLVCSNGLTDSAAESTIAEALGSDRPPEEIAARLIELAAASEDDVTALVARYHVPA
jgi:PPM family protein phosphatase